MVCSQCGTQLAQNSMYCSSCGNNIKNQVALPTPSTSNHSPNLGIDKKQLKYLLFGAMFLDGSVLVATITSGVGISMMFSTLFLALIFCAYTNLQKNKYSEAKNYCLAGAVLNGFFAVSNISGLSQIPVIIVLINEVFAAVILTSVYYELNSKVKDS